MDVITHHHDSAAWSAVLFVALLLAFVMIVHWLRCDLRERNRKCRDVLLHPAHRLMAGTSMIFAGGLMRLAAALPLQPLQIAREWGWWWWWSGWAEWVTAGGSVMIVAGLVVMTWPALYGRLGVATLPAIFAGVALVYALGLAATEIVLWWI